jgi:hypothetical protein
MFERLLQMTLPLVLIAMALSVVLMPWGASP